MFGGRYGLHLSVEEVTLWVRLLVRGASEVVPLVVGSAGATSVESPSGPTGARWRVHLLGEFLRAAALGTPFEAFTSRAFMADRSNSLSTAKKDGAMLFDNETTHVIATGEQAGAWKFNLASAYHAAHTEGMCRGTRPGGRHVRNVRGAQQAAWKAVSSSDRSAQPAW